jgi:hypothetical protein
VERAGEAQAARRVRRAAVEAGLDLGAREEGLRGFKTPVPVSLGR